MASECAELHAKNRLLSPHHSCHYRYHLQDISPASLL